MAKSPDKQPVTALMATRSQSHIEILVETQEGKSATLRLPYTAYDEKTNGYVPDKKAKERAEENLKSIGLKDFDNVELDSIGHEFEAYVVGEKATLWEPKEFIEFSRVTSTDARQIRAIAKDYDFKTLPLTEWEGHRFNFGIAIEDAGEVKNFRISQFVLESTDPEKEDVRIPVKYENKNAATFEAALKNRENMNQEAVERTQAAIKRLNEKSRQELIDTYQKELGVDINHLLETDDHLNVSIRVDVVQGKDPIRYLTAVVDSDSLDDLVRDVNAEATDSSEESTEEE